MLLLYKIITSHLFSNWWWKWTHYWLTMTLYFLSFSALWFKSGWDVMSEWFLFLVKWNFRRRKKKKDFKKSVSRELNYLASHSGGFSLSSFKTSVYQSNNHIHLFCFMLFITRNRCPDGLLLQSGNLSLCVVTCGWAIIAFSPSVTFSTRSMENR